LPRFASADPAEVQRLQAAAVRTLVAILTPVSIVAIAVLHPFLGWWVGAELASAATPVGVILIAGFWVHGIGHIASTITMGRGRPDIVMKLLLAYLVPYLVLLYIFTNLMGVTGAAVAWSLRSACDPILFFFTKPERASIAKMFEGAAIVLAATAIGLVLAWTSTGYWLGLTGLLALSCYASWQTLSHWLRRALAWAQVVARA
jgi:O-antigen/teichoic acid export membrane protein